MGYAWWSVCDIQANCIDTLRKLVVVLLLDHLLICKNLRRNGWWTLLRRGFTEIVAIQLTCNSVCPSHHAWLSLSSLCVVSND